MFKAYDIRGVYPEQINGDFAYAFGKTFVQVLGVKTVVIGRDMRISSDEIFERLSEGVRSMGADVIDLGRVSTDMLYFASGKYGYDAGIMITASHNPKQWNGIKACLKNAEPLSLENGLGEIRDMMLRSDISETSEQGSFEARDVLEEWIDHVLSFVNVANIAPMKIVADAGNGMAGRMVTRLFERLPQLTLVPLYFEEDGAFPNHPASPLEEENLVDIKGKMEQEEADLGFAFDGDADRVFLIDEKYETLTGTLMTAMVAKSVLKKHPGATILYNAICGRIVPATVEKNGGKSLRVQVGHSLIKKDMKTHGALFAGEHSGHYYFADNWNADSGLIAAVIMLDLLGVEGKKLGQARKEFETYVASGEINFTVNDIKGTLERLEETYMALEIDHLDGLSVHDVDWWANIRASNTEPLLRLNVEAKTEEQLEKIVENITKIIVQ